MQRRSTRLVKIGDVPVGAGHPISIQSMTNTRTSDAAATLAQISELRSAGCEIIRVAVPDREAVQALPEIIAGAEMPVVADIHFDHHLAIAAARAGVQALRINPGNIGGREKVRQVVRVCREQGIPIRIGVNSGSLEKDLKPEKELKRGDAAKKETRMAEALVASAARHIKYLTAENFQDIIVSLKSSSVTETLEANRLFAEGFDYPLHIGITEAGAGRSGEIKSAAGIAALLSQGLGDTVRVSLTAPPVEEVQVAYEILASLGLRRRPGNLEIISCPTCGRTEINLERIAREVRQALEQRASDPAAQPLTVAVMGCAVNGPGEAARADIGIAGGKKSGVIFRQGKVVKKVPEEELVSALLAEINKMECE